MRQEGMREDVSYRATTEGAILRLSKRLEGWRLSVSSVGGPYETFLLPETPTIDELLSAAQKTAGAHLKREVGQLQWLRTSVKRGPALEIQAAASRRFSYLSVLIGVIAVAASLAAFLISLPASHPTGEFAADHARLQALTAQVDGTQKAVQNLSETLKQYPPDTKPMAEIAILKVQIEKLSTHLADYEVALGDDAAKRLAVVTLRKDVDAMRDQHKADITAMHDELSRTFDFLKWLLGLLGVGSLISGIGGLFKRPTKETTAKPAE
jgi:hypothetical protein